MKKLLILFVLLFCSAGLAQNTTSYYAGGSLGVIFGGVTAFGPNLYFGADDLFSENFGVRGSLGFAFASGQSIFALSADAVYDFSAPSSPLRPYAGAGLRLGLVNVSGLGTVTAVGAGLLGGVEYLFTPQFGTFGELNLNLVTDVGFAPSLALGVNYHF